MLLSEVGTRPPHYGIRGAGGTIYNATSYSAGRCGQVVNANSPSFVPSREPFSSGQRLAEAHQPAAATGGVPQWKSVPSTRYDAG